MLRKILAGAISAVLGLGMAALPTVATAAEPVELGSWAWIDAPDPSDYFNGVQDAGEEPAVGVAVSLECADGATGTTTTDEAGEYYFNDGNVDPALAPATDCTITFDTAGTAVESFPLTQPHYQYLGGDPELDSDAIDVDGVPTITLTTPAEGEDHTFDAGFAEVEVTCAVGDFVWADADGDGIQDDGEEPVSGITVEMHDQDEQLVASTRTDDEGYYIFDHQLCKSDLENYRARFSDLPEGMTFTVQEAGDDPGTDSNAGRSGATASFGLGFAYRGRGELSPNSRRTVESDQVRADFINPTIDAGVIPERQPVPGIEIGNQLWWDSQEHDTATPNGVQDARELAAVDAFSDITVSLACADGASGTTMPNSAGEYYFNDTNVDPALAPSTDCTITFDVLLQLTKPGVGDDDTVDSDAFLADGKPTISLTTPATGADHSYDVGVVDDEFKCSVGDFVWADADGDGIQDDGEEPVPDVFVELLSSSNEVVVGTTTTNEEGYFILDTQTCSSGYFARFSDLPEGASFTSRQAGSDEAVDSNPDADGVTEVFTLGGGQPINRVRPGNNEVKAFWINPTIDAGIILPEPEPEPEPGPQSDPHQNEPDVEALPATGANSMIMWGMIAGSVLALAGVQAIRLRSSRRTG